MKKSIYLIISFLLLSFSLSFSQSVALVVTGMVTDSAGNPIGNNPVQIYSSSNPLGLWTTTNSFGRYTDSIGVVSGDSITVMSLDCDSSGYYYNFHGGQWINGDTLISDFLMCGGMNSCSGGFTYISNGINSISFTAFNNQPGTNFNYVWILGDGSNATGTTVNHVYANPGTYTVCVTASSSLCTFTYCGVVIVGTSNPTYSLGGLVLKDGVFDQGIQGTAVLLQPDTNNPTGAWNAIDTTSLDSGGYYYFGGLSAGNYHVVAMLDPSDVDFNAFFPTYYTNSTSWVSSTVINLNSNFLNADIDLQKIILPRVGSGSITGTVIDDGFMNPGMPMENIQVQLFDQSGNETTFLMSDNSGSFDFSNLDFGTYELRVEIAGITSVVHTIILSSGIPTDDVTFLVGNNSVVLNLLDTKVLEGIKAYPNPVKDVLVLDIPSELSDENLTLEIISLTGKVLRSNEGLLDGKVVDISELNSGFYLLRFEVDGFSKTINIVKD